MEVSLILDLSAKTRFDDTDTVECDDLVLMVKGKPVVGLADFYRKIWGLGTAGIDVPLTILRGVKIQEMKIRSGDRYQFLLIKMKKT